MYYAIICEDDGDQSETRKRLMLDHLRHVETVVDKIVVGGPRPATTPGGPTQGSFMIFKAESADAARALMLSDPLAKAGVWKSVTVTEFNPVVGEVVGGTTWTITDGKVGPKAAQA